jgi:hypothetical protein
LLGQARHLTRDDAGNGSHIGAPARLAHRTDPCRHLTRRGNTARSAIVEGVSAPSRSIGRAGGR